MIANILPCAPPLPIWPIILLLGTRVPLTDGALDLSGSAVYDLDLSVAQTRSQDVLVLIQIDAFESHLPHSRRR